MSQSAPESFWSLLLSHHPVGKRHLCYQLNIGKSIIYLCARCLGLFPAMFSAIAIGYFTGPWPWQLAWCLLFLAPLPALLDWGTQTGSGKPERSNRLRLITGVGLGAAIGTNLHMQTYALLSYQAVAQLTFLLGSVWMVWLISYIRRNRERYTTKRNRQRQMPNLEEYLKQQLSPQWPVNQIGQTKPRPKS